MKYIVCAALGFLGAALILNAHSIDRARCAAKGGELGWLCLDKNGNSIN